MRQKNRWSSTWVVILIGLFIPAYILFFTSIGLAHHPGVEAGLGISGPLRTIAASTPPQGRFALSAQMEMIDLDGFSDAELTAFSFGGSDVHSADSIWHFFLTGSYGVTDDFTIGLKLPYIHIENIRESHADEPGEVHVHGDSKGFGDLSLFGQYRFWNRDGIEAAVILGVEMPTGRTSARDLEGVRFETEFQPGSGSWDPFLGLAAQKSFGKVAVAANVLYLLATEGSQDTDLGDSFTYNVAAGYSLYNKGDFSLSLVAELNGETKAKQEIRSIKDPNSGGTMLLLSPGARLFWKERLSGFVSVGFPIVEDLNGIQNDLNQKLLLGLSLQF